MSVDLRPTDLSFRRPFNREVNETLHLRNNNNDVVAFKVKTTAPKHYCVRPNSGRIEPGKHVEVQVLLQAMKEEPAPDAKCKDKFLVQSVAITGDFSFSNITSIFENASKASIQERKIRVSWLPEETNGPASEEPGLVDENAAGEDEPPAYTTSPSGAYETPAIDLTKKGLDSSPLPQPDFTEKTKSEPTSPDNSTTVAGTLRSTVANTISMSTEELKAQLAEADATIQRLKDQLANQVPLLRKSEGGSGSSGENALMMQQHHSQSVDLGVPLQVVAGLCLLSFLLGYIFF